MQITVCGQILSYMLWYPIYGSVYLLVWAVVYQVVVVVRPVLFYGYNSKLDAPSHYGLLSIRSYINIVQSY